MSAELTVNQVEDIATDVLFEWLDGYHYLSDGTQVKLTYHEDGWHIAYADTPYNDAELGVFILVVGAEMVKNGP